MLPNRPKLIQLLDEHLTEDGVFPTPIPGVFLVKRSQQDQRTKRHWRSCFGIVAQGCKEVVLEGKAFRASEFHYTATPIDLPVVSRIAVASKKTPLLAILIDFDSSILSALTSEMDKLLPPSEYVSSKAIFVGKANEKMIECATRLIELLGRPEEAPVLGPIIIKELFYYLLKSESGDLIRQFVRSGSTLHKVGRAIHAIKAELDQEISIVDLAKSASMSRSAFFKYFKESTSMSPIQYQKRLRLLEARRLMLETGETAEGASYKVGYKSPSQFNREYSRMFGNSPLKDITKLKAVSKFIAEA